MIVPQRPDRNVVCHNQAVHVHVACRLRVCFQLFRSPPTSQSVRMCPEQHHSCIDNLAIVISTEGIPWLVYGRHNAIVRMFVASIPWPVPRRGG